MPGVGLVGATGSWQSHYTTVFKKHKIFYEFDKSVVYNFRKYKLFLKAVFFWRFLFGAFPSPHIRTTAFIIKPEIFFQLSNKQRFKTKFDAYIFENGRNSLTNQLLHKGFKILVIDNKGIHYEIGKWHLSKTFWISNQENLLISDNQTRIYDNAPEDQKKL